MHTIPIHNMVDIDISGARARAMPSEQEDVRRRRSSRRRRGDDNGPHCAKEDADQRRGGAGSHRQANDFGESSLRWSYRHHVLALDPTQSSSPPSSSQNGASTGVKKKKGGAVEGSTRSPTTAVAGSRPSHPFRPPPPPPIRGRGGEGGNVRGRSLSMARIKTQQRLREKESARGGHVRSLSTLRHQSKYDGKLPTAKSGGCGGSTLPLIDTNGERIQRSKPSSIKPTEDSRKAAGDGPHQKAPSSQSQRRRVGREKSKTKVGLASRNDEKEQSREPEGRYGGRDSSIMITIASKKSPKTAMAGNDGGAAASPRRAQVGDGRRKSASRSQKGNGNAVPAHSSAARPSGTRSNTASESKKKGLSRSQNQIMSVPAISLESSGEKKDHLSRSLNHGTAQTTLSETRAKKKNRLSRSLNNGSAPPTSPADLHSSTDALVFDRVSEGDDTEETTELTESSRGRTDGVVSPAPPPSSEPEPRSRRGRDVSTSRRTKNDDLSSSRKFVVEISDRGEVVYVREFDDDKPHLKSSTTVENDEQREKEGHHRSTGPTVEEARRHWRRDRRREGRGRSTSARSEKAPANYGGGEDRSGFAAPQTALAAVESERRDNAVVAQATTEFDHSDDEGAACAAVASASRDESPFTKREEETSTPPSNDDGDDDDDPKTGRSIIGLVARVRELSMKSYSRRRSSSRSASHSRRSRGRPSSLRASLHSSRSRSGSRASVGSCEGMLPAVATPAGGMAEKCVKPEDDKSTHIVSNQLAASFSKDQPQELYSSMEDLYSSMYTLVSVENEDSADYDDRPTEDARGSGSSGRRDGAYGPSRSAATGVRSAQDDSKGTSPAHFAVGRGSNSAPPPPLPDLCSSMNTLVFEESESEDQVASHRPTSPPESTAPGASERGDGAGGGPRWPARVLSDRDKSEGMALTCSTTVWETSSAPNGKVALRPALDLSDRSDGSRSAHRSVSFMDRDSQIHRSSTLSSSTTSQESRDVYHASAPTSSTTGHGSQIHRASTLSSSMTSQESRDDYRASATTSSTTGHDSHIHRAPALPSSTTNSQDQFLPYQQQTRGRLAVTRAISDRDLPVSRRARSLSTSHNPGRDAQNHITSDYPSSFAANCDRPGSPPASAPRKARSLSRIRDVAVRDHVDFDPQAEDVARLPRRSHRNEVVFPLEKNPIKKAPCPITPRKHMSRRISCSKSSRMEKEIPFWPTRLHKWQGGV